jgi:hypothetical protein
MPLLTFFQDKVAAGIALLLGPVISIGSLILHAYALHDMGLPIEIWVSIGLLIFFLGVVGVLYKSLSEGTIRRTLVTEPQSSGNAEISAIATIQDATNLVRQDVFLEVNDNPNITYKRKLRIILRNDSGRTITIRGANGYAEATTTYF